MLSFQKMYERCQSQSSDDDATSLALFKAWISEGVKKCYSVLNAERFYFESTDLTVASQNSYPLPAQCEKIHTIKTTVSSVDYITYEWQGTEEQWNALTDGSGATESDYPQWFFVKKDTVELYPTPSTDSYTLTFKYKINPKDLSAANHTTESIKTAVVGSTAIVGNTGTTWTAAMAGRYLKITADGIWYRIASVTDATNLVLSREYDGQTISAGSENYTISECSLLPEPFQEAPVFYSLMMYYIQKENLNLSNNYRSLWEEALQNIRVSSNDTTSGVLSDENIMIRNPADFPTGLS